MVTKNKKIKTVLDCTLRDGGYYTDWTFDTTLVRKLVSALDNNGIDIIEMGYKSPNKGGPYRKCNDGFINSVINFKIKCKLAFMIDAKDFIIDNEINIGLIEDIIKPATASPFSICRIAAKADETKYLPILINTIRSLGYDVYCNLMSISSATDAEIVEYCSVLKANQVVGRYVADSYGALTPERVREIFSTYDVNGIHTHDNLGLAFANCLVAIDNNAEYVDGTLLGMGRGVGNVRTEQLLTWRTTITADLLDSIDDFEKLQRVYKWGHNTLYMIAGMNRIHPLYIQDLNGSNLTNSDLLAAVNELRTCDKYDPKKTQELKTQRAVVVIPARYKSNRFPGKPLAKIHGKEMVLHVAERAVEAVGIDNVYIATEDLEVAHVVTKAGLQVILTSDNCLTGTDRVAEAMREIKADIYVNVQGDEPMIDPKDIQSVIKLKQQYPDHIINCMANLQADEESTDLKIPKIICDLDNNLLYCSRSAIPGNKNGKSSNVLKQVCIYAFSANQLMNFYSQEKTPLEYEEDIEIVRCLEKGMAVKMLQVTNVSYAVDYPSDIKLIENKLKVI